MDSVEAIVERTVDRTIAKLIDGSPVLPVKEWLNPDEASEYLGVTRGHLETLRRKQAGPAFKKFGPRLVRYKLSALNEFMEKLPGREA